ncbi:cell division protein FtsQ/DivIB [Fodinibius sediminis]|uniref:Cell division septal protein FtsQ n=1 Tax=Fodinibius sediminis TaxID=1214077 RepID=A0A521C5H2_9BACT|nr:cell division protein FtsQ/DivIB [Fodinibius sediminis]SMO54643.1 Cell division septal protein FtsQ [Fodinibius sediminis]
MTNEKKHSPTEAPTGRSNPLPWVAAALFILGLAVVAGFYWSSNMKVQKVYYEGHSFVSEAQLREIEIPTGIHPDSLNTMQIIDQFEQIPYVKRAAVDVTPGGNLTIRISERKPVAMLADGDTKRYVDEEGVRLPVVLNRAVNVPLLYGFDAGAAGDTLSGQEAQAALNFLGQLREKPVSDATISEIAWTDNGIVALTNQHGVKLIFGKKDFGTRLRNWEAFYAEIIKQKGIESMRSVDLRFQGQIVTHEQ